MNRPLTTKILIFILSGLALTAEAQQWLGRTTGNYAGTYGVYSNPSSISDSKYAYYFNFWGRGVNFYNNYLSYNAPVKINHWANNSLQMNQYRNFDGSVMFSDDWLLENLDGKNKYFSFNQDIWGPAFMFPVSRNWNMSVNTRQRSGMQMFGISESAAVMAKRGIDSGQYASVKNNFSANVQSFQELSFTLGGIMAQNNRHKLHGGVTFKMIRGLGAAYLKGTELNIQGTGSNSALVNGNFDYAYTDDKSAVAPFNDPYGLFSLQSRGAGAGFDLGLTYTFRSEKLKHRSKWDCDRNDIKSDYDFKLSLALNDIGGIRFNRQSTLYSYGNLANSPVGVSSDILDGFRTASQNGFDSIGTQVFAQLGAARSSGFSTSLPAAINLQADLRWSRHFYTSLFWNQSLKGHNITGLRSTSMISLAPRFESRAFEFSMPLTLSENYRNFYVGMYTRIGPVFFGSDNLGGLLNVASSSQFTGADIYGGISFGIGHCASWWYKDQVDPVYMDSVKNDTLRTELRDTVKISHKDTVIIKDTVTLVKKDTVYLDKKGKPVVIRDTVVIEKTVKVPANPARELELKKKEEELNRRKVQLDAKEKELNDRDKRPSEPVGMQDCINRNNVLETENRTLKNRVNTQAEEIDALKKQVEEINRQKAALELENKKCAEEKVKTNAEIIRLQEEIMKANRKISDLETEVAVLKRAQSSWTTPDLSKGTDAEKIARANKQIDSLKLRVIYLETDLEKCKKNAVQNQAEVLKRAEADKNKAENNAKVARKQADSLAYILSQRTLELENCKKTGTQNNAEVLKKAEADKAKAESDARVARKQADSLAYILSQRTLELENCKKNGTQNDAQVQKLKNCENENVMLKAEMQEMTKTINRLNTKNYALSYRVDSLITELKNCCKNCGTGNSDDAELLKKCQDGKVALEAEVVRLKAGMAGKDKTIDSLKVVNDAQVKRQTELNAQISKLNTEIADLKSKGSNCDELQKQLDAKNAELSKLSSENTALQNQVKTLNAQLGEYKTEYNFMVKQSQKCSAQLDSCKRGLYQTKPEEPKNGGDSGSGGPNEGNNGNGNDEVYSGRSSKTSGTLSKIVNVMIDAANQSSRKTTTSSGNSSGSSGTQKDSSGGGNGGTVKKPTESTGSGTTGSNRGSTGTSGNTSGDGSNGGSARNTGGGQNNSGTAGNNGGTSGSRAGDAASGSGARR